MKKLCLKGMGLWGLMALFYLYEMVLRVSPSIMENELRDAFYLTSGQFGLLVSLYYYAYTPLQIPCGFILDKIGLRFLMTFSCLLCALGTLLFAFGPTVLLAGMGRFMVGAGSACAFVGCVKVVNDYFPPGLFPVMVGITSMMGNLGGLLSGHFLVFMEIFCSWKATLLILAGIGALISLSLWFFLRPGPKETALMPSVSFLKSVGQVAREKQVWLSGAIGGLMYIPIGIFAELWGTPFLMATYGIPKEKASLVSLVIFIGMAVGSPLMAQLGHFLKSYKKVILFCSAGLTAIFLAIGYARFFSFEFILILSALAGFLTGGQVLSFTFAQFSSSSALNGITMSFTNALIMIFPLILQPLLGKILDFFWDGTIDALGLRKYTTEVYQFGMFLLPVCMAAGTFLIFFLKEVYQEEKNSK